MCVCVWGGGGGGKGEEGKCVKWKGRVGKGKESGTRGEGRGMRVQDR